MADYKHEAPAMTSNHDPYGGGAFAAEALHRVRWVTAQVGAKGSFSELVVEGVDALTVGGGFGLIQCREFDDRPVDGQVFAGLNGASRRAGEDEIVWARQP